MKSRILTISIVGALMSASAASPSAAGSAFFQFNSNGLSIQLGDPPGDDGFADIEPADEGLGTGEAMDADAAVEEVVSDDEMPPADPGAVATAWGLHVASCRIRYRTYRPSDNSFMSNAGYRKPCRSQWVQ